MGERAKQRELGAICKRGDRRERFQICLMNLSILSLSVDESLQINSSLSLLARDSQGWQWREGR